MVMDNARNKNELLQYMPLASFICDAQGMLTSYNSPFFELFGVLPHNEETCAAFLQKRLLSPRAVDFEKLNSPLNQALRFGVASHNVQLSMQTTSGTSTLLMNLEPMRSRNQDVVGVVGQLTDVSLIANEESALKEVNQELLVAREEALRCSRAKSDFLANMSHEIRTPMNAVMGMSELLWETNLSDHQREFLQVLIKGGRNLLSIINDILGFSRLEGGQMPVQARSFDLHRLISHVTDVMRPEALRKNLQLQIECELGDVQVVGDEGHLQQVLEKLLSNAIKFTARGRVSLKIAARSNRTGNVQFTIADTGVGIPEHKMHKLFESFHQADCSSKKVFGGTGLGLVIAKQLVELMGGTMWVESEEGKGTCVHFTVKLPPATHRDADSDLSCKPKKVSLGGARILLVEDSRDNAFLISHYLKNADCHIDHAVNGKEAVRMYIEHEYDLVLMDMQMPEMDGYSATKWIRILEQKRNHHIPIIALTAYALQEDAKRSFEAGCDAHLTKPISKADLLKSLCSHVDVPRDQISS